jgi:hypothetical protein
MLGRSGLLAGRGRYIVFVLLNRVSRNVLSSFEQSVAKREEESEHREHKPPRYAGAFVMPPVGPVLGHGGRLRCRVGGGSGSAAWAVVAGYIRPVRQLRAWQPAMTQVIQHGSRFGRLDAARLQRHKDLRVRVTCIDQAPGKFHIRRQNLVYHISRPKAV